MLEVSRAEKILNGFAYIFYFLDRIYKIYWIFLFFVSG